LTNCEKCYEEVGVDTIDLGIIDLTPSFLYKKDFKPKKKDEEEMEDVIELLPKIINQNRF